MLPRTRENNIMSKPTNPQNTAVLRLRSVSRNRAVRKWPVMTSDQVASAAVASLAQRLEQAAFTNVMDRGPIDVDRLTHLVQRLLNNCGTSYVDDACLWQAKQMEREVLTIISDLFRAPADDRWGYVTSGGTESNLAALHQARERYPNAVVYLSAAAHYSIERCASILGMPTRLIDTDDTGNMAYEDLAAHLIRDRHRPAVIVATIGTTMAEAVDDIRRITAIADAIGLRNRWIHGDFAIASLPLALLAPDTRPGIDFGDGADSMAIGHRFNGVPAACGLMIVRRSLCYPTAMKPGPTYTRTQTSQQDGQQADTGEAATA
jgi:histidine decarboxylase